LLLDTKKQGFLIRRNTPKKKAWLVCLCRWKRGEERQYCETPTTANKGEVVLSFPSTGERSQQTGGIRLQGKRRDLVAQHLPKNCEPLLLSPSDNKKEGKRTREGKTPASAENFKLQTQRGREKGLPSQKKGRGAGRQVCFSERRKKDATLVSRSAPT